MENSIPSSWCQIRVGETGSCITGNTPSTKDPSNYGGSIPLIKPPQLNNQIVSVGDESLSEKGAQLARVLPENSVLVSCIGNLGRTALNTVPVAFNQQINSIVPNRAVFSKFLFYQVQSTEFRLQLEEKATATTISIVNKGNFEKILVKIAPFNEQKRIVAKIEELFSELDNGIAALKTAREQLQVYRQALLKHAFEGKLTTRWREESVDKLESPEQLLARIQKEREARYQQQLEEWESAVKMWETNGKEGKKPSKPKQLKDWEELKKNVLIKLPIIPDSWAWKKLGFLTTGVEYGTSAKSSESGLTPVIRMGNLQNGSIDWSDLVYTSDLEEIEKYSLRKNDVLFNRTNSPELVGKTAKYKGERPALFAGYLIRINQIETIVLSNYVNYFLNSHIAKQYGNSVKTDGVNQSNINGEKLQNYPFPFCSIEEQSIIVEMLEEKLSLTDASLQDIADQLGKAEALRQSILKKAFSGQLVPQDPNDEPASELLARIHAEREATKTKNTKKARKAK